ncbi:MAG: hypothetical protein WBF06_17350 [Candidatus Acidiferrales bacterium]
MRFKALIGALALLIMMGYTSTASATLTTAYTFTGDDGVSVDAGGSTASTLPDGLTADVPNGSTVVAAYLYTSTFNGTFEATGYSAGDVFSSVYAGGTLNGNSVSYTALIANSDASYLQAGVANVTSIVAAEVNPSGALSSGSTVYNFAVTESDTAYQDGEVLVVVYSNPSLPTNSIGILDGAAASGGDTSSIEFASNPAGDTVLMSIGDGFSYDLDGSYNEQTSTITVDGSTLTSAAGNCDESQDGGTEPNATGCSNGDLITAGVLGLNSDGSIDTAYSNPVTPIGDTDSDTDHELYNISSLIDPLAGNTISLTTSNSSYDDNIFLEVFDVEGLAGFNAPPPMSGAEPGSLGLMLIGLCGLGLLRKFRTVANAA